MRVGGFRIRDPLLGDIKANQLELSIIETPEFQRLRRISQIGFSSLVYPGATHARFTHSLGTMGITKEIHRNIYGGDNEELSLAALLHDLGHAPFSHASDSILEKYLHTTHEKIGEKKIREGVIRDKISSGHSFYRFLKYFRGKGKGVIFSGTLGSDRMDYLSRDAYYTGVNYGVIDQHRLKYKLQMEKGKLAVNDYDINIAESMLIARYLMFTAVYMHHTALIADAMYEKALSAAIDSSEIDPKELEESDDGELSLKLQSYKASPIAKKLFSRHLYKRAFYTESKVDATENEIAEGLERAGEEEFIVKKAKIKPSGEDLYVIDKSGSILGQLSKISPIVKSINEVIESKEILVVACEKSRVEKVKRVVGKLL
ncbi:MAG: HD domain-containing protein [Candidatus Micrarchaeia archaeon]